ncbi:MAG TPA: Hsp20/alpha crystallin family protein [Anaerolineae bacterium]|nr:Hsp20/alpha crystallin family protein [Anaerolineae bacterium]
MAEEKTLQVEETQKKEVEQSDAERTRPGVAFVPRVDIYETDAGIHIVCDMPGVDENSVDIVLEKNVLTLNGYVTPQQPEGYNLVYAEYRIGDYQRRFTLSNEIDQDKIEATVKDGILRLVLPKAIPTSRRIAVKGS